MGLTIHYRLRTPLTAPGDIRDLLDTLRSYARELPFKEVSELIEFKGKDADYQESNRDDPHRWFKIQAGEFVEHDGGHYTVNPTHIIGFSTWPGEGCESANFGFSRFPPSMDVPTTLGRSRTIRTGLTGWRWRSFCKTQYASDPNCGGLRNFLRCHLCVVKLLDFAKATGLISVDVSDEGDYWEHRDIKKLGREVGNWNEMIAALSGQLQDIAGQEGVALESAIAQFPNFEHLEAKGVAKLEALRKKSRPDAE